MTKYFIDGEPHYMHNGHSLTQAEKDIIDNKNYDKGFNERMAGFYDKWYRYNTYDNGTAYDRGVVAAVDSGKCVHDCQIIECFESQIG